MNGVLIAALVIMIACFALEGLGGSQSAVETRATKWCDIRCEVLSCSAFTQRCDIRFHGRPAYSMDCRGEACSW